MPAHITMDLAEYEQIKQARTDAENVAAKLREDLKLAMLAKPDLGSLTELSRNLLTVARFAVGNLPPETTKGWPCDALRTASQLLQALPDHSLDDASLAIELRNFADEAATFERARNLPAAG